MPIDFHADPETRLIQVKVSGMITTPELLEGIDRILSDPGMSPGLRVFSDHRELELPATFEQIDALLERIEQRQDRVLDARWAILTRQPESYGMMRVLSMLAGVRIPGMDVQVFTDLAAATQWLENAPSSVPSAG